MSWLLLLHIAAMLCWCGSLLYMPALIASIVAQRHDIVNASELKQFILLPRIIFRLILTPAALIAILSGTLVFITMNTIALWLVIKLTLVVGLIICHTLNGWLILKIEQKSLQNPNPLCLLIGLISVALMIAIIGIVLAKPQIGAMV